MIDGKLTRIGKASLAERITAGGRDLVVVVVNLPFLQAPERALVRPVPHALPHHEKPRRLGWKSIALLAFLPIATMSALALRPSDDHRSIRIMLPPTRVAEASAPQALPHIVDVPPHLSSALARASAPPRFRTARPRPTDAFVEIDKLPEVEAATQLALTSGVAQRWQALGLSGAVVAGPVQVQGGSPCRTVSVMTSNDTGSAGTTASMRCMTRNGGWIRPVAAAAVPIAPPNEDPTSAVPADDAQVAAAPQPSP